MAVADLGDLYMQGVEAVHGRLPWVRPEAAVVQPGGGRKRRFCVPAARCRASAGKLPAPGSSWHRGWRITRGPGR